MIFTIVGGIGSVLFVALFAYSSYVLGTSVHPGVQVVPITREQELRMIPEGREENGDANNNNGNANNANNGNNANEENDSESSVLTQHSTGRSVNNHQGRPVGSDGGMAYSISRITVHNNSEVTGTGGSNASLEVPSNASIITSASTHRTPVPIPPEDIRISWVEYYARLYKLRQPLLFIMVFAVSIYGVCSARWELYMSVRKRDEIFAEWIICIFTQYFNGYTDQLNPSASNYDTLYTDTTLRDNYAHHMCGDSPKALIPLYEIIWFYFGIFGHPLIAAIVFLKPRLVQKFFYKCCGCFR